MDNYVKETAANIHATLLAENNFDMNIHELEHLVKVREQLWHNENIDADIEVFADDHRNPETPSGVALVWVADGKHCHQVFRNS